MQPPSPDSQYLMRPVLDGDDGRAPRVLHVDPCVAAVAARVAVVVPELRLRDEREDESRDGALLVSARGCRERRRREAGEEECDELSLGLSSGGVSWDGALRFALEGRDASRPPKGRRPRPTGILMGASDNE